MVDIVERWNAAVHKKDTIYPLGDVWEKQTNYEIHQD
jgi:calcineurin-like phosphoesterase family protein